MPVRRDDTVFDDIAARIDNMGAFDAVVLGAGPDEEPVAAEKLGVCWIQRVSWTAADRVDPIQKEREVAFVLTIAVRDEQAVFRLRRQCYLEAVASKAIEGLALGGFCMPAFSRLGGGSPIPGCQPPPHRLGHPGGFPLLPAPGYRPA